MFFSAAGATEETKPKRFSLDDASGLVSYLAHLLFEKVMKQMAIDFRLTKFGRLYRIRCVCQD